MPSLMRCTLLAMALALPIPALAETQPFDRVDDWTLMRTAEGGRVQHCHAVLSAADGSALVFEHNAAFTAFGFRTGRSHVPGGSERVDVFFDSDPRTATQIEMPHWPEWRVYQSPNDEPDGLLDMFANRSAISFGYDVPGRGYETVSFSLRGSNMMTRRIYDCVQNPAATAPAQPPQAAAPQSYGWINAGPGSLGGHLVMGGLAPDGMQVFVCGAFFNGGFHPGMTGMWSSDICAIGYGGAEHRVAPYQLLTGQGNWRAFDGAIPSDAVEGGYEANGDKLYICRGWDQGMPLVGKFRMGFRGCNIADGGSEVTISRFDLLTF
ncbi:MAG: DUF3421 domain-containing protein [Paracoccaceae bacterium]|nr:MAG: DUF3421 domain-containing protein [Paracoccaceae bacterium]